MKRQLIALALLSACSANNSELKSTESKGRSPGTTYSGNGTQTQMPSPAATPEELNPEATAPAIVSGAYLACDPSFDGKIVCYTMDEAKTKKQKYSDTSKVKFIFTKGSNQEDLLYTAIQGAQETLFVLDMTNKTGGDIQLVYDGEKSRPYHTDWLPTDPTEFMASLYRGTDEIPSGVFLGDNEFGDANNTNESTCKDAPTVKSRNASGVPSTGTSRIKLVVAKNDRINFIVFTACGVQTTDATFRITGGNLRSAGVISHLIPDSTQGNYLVFDKLALDAGEYIITFENKGFITPDNRDNIIFDSFSFGTEGGAELESSFL